MQAVTERVSDDVLIKKLSVEYGTLMARKFSQSLRNLGETSLPTEKLLEDSFRSLLVDRKA